MYEVTRTFSVLALAAVLSTGFFPARCNAQSTASAAGDLDSQIESLRADLRADKIAIVTDNMKFTAQESAAFWPIYRKYEVDLAHVNDERVAIIKQYAEKYTTLTDADAKQMATQSFDLESRRADLKKRYFKEFNQQISAVTCARFFQLEHRLDLIVDLKIASELPPLLVKSAASPAEAPKQ